MKNTTKQYIFGFHPVAEAINSGKEINRILIRKGARGDNVNELFQKIRELGIPYQFVPVEKLNRITRANHQGIIAFLSLIEYKSLEEIIQRTFEAGRDPFILILDRITDVRNFGAIARTAECAGVDAIVVPERESVAVTPDAIKTSAGALSRIDVVRRKSLLDAVNYLRESGIRIVAVSEKASDYYYKCDLTGPIALIMGAEDSGISQSLLDIAESKMKIPMAGTVESLNVSVACGILLFETVKQRNK